MNCKFNKSFLVIIFSLLFHFPVFAEQFKANTDYQVCFTPKQNCTALIVNQIHQAKKSVYVQAYSFTSTPIAKAILDAQRKGLEVVVILDKSQIKSNRYSASRFLMNNKIPVLITNHPLLITR